jgi:hypothetical protein
MSPTRLVTLLLALVVSLTGLGASAQTPSASAIPPIDQFTGIQAAASRTYLQDIESMLAATPDLDLEAVYRGLVSTSVMVLEFDNAGNAATAYDDYTAGIVSDLPTMAQGGTPEVTRGEIADIGSRANLARLHTVTSDEYESWLDIVTVQDDRYVYVVTALTAVEEELGMATDVAAWVATNGASAGDEAIFVADGGSTGGIWGFMPPVGNETLDGLIPIVDEILYPAPEA